MEKGIKTFDFNHLPIEVEVKDLKFAKELPRLLGRPHRLTFNQIVWLTEGEAKFYIDFQEIIIKPAEVLIISPGQVCQFDVTSDYSGKIILFTHSFFAVTETDTNFLYTAEILNPVSHQQTIPIGSMLMDNLIMVLEDELKEPPSMFQTGIAQSCLRIILYESERRLTQSYPAVTNPVARQFTIAVEQYFKENKNTEFYVASLGVNEKSLSKEVKSLTGKTPKAYIKSRVILEAKRLLTYSSLSVKQIGFELGFDEPTNFNKYFHKHANTTPLQFRKLMQNN